MKFSHLHFHSEYSLLDGLPKIDEMLDYVKELGMDSIALTDHGNLYGAVEFYKKAKKKGIKSIIGVEMYIAFEKMTLKRPNIDNKRYHLVLLVKNEKGYKNLVKIVTASNLKGFYYKPRVDEAFLFEHSEGLICLSGCVQGKIPRLISAKKNEEAKKLAQKYKEVFGKDNFYLEIQDHPNVPEQKKVNETLIKFSKELEIPLVATNDCHYLKREDAKIQDILMMINTGAKSDDPERLTMKMDDFSMRSPAEMINSFKNVPEAIKNTQKIVAQCNFQFDLGKIKLPFYPLPEEKTADKYLKELCEQGLKKRKMKKDKNVVDRLEHELLVIKQTGFASYFLIVQDFVNWAKENRIVVGPGRGSAPGSLVSYLLGITSVNPLKYNLLFERFLTNSRISPPDIDLDFADRRRDEVIDYLRQKYGKEHVAQIITFGRMASRAVIRDVGRALKYPYSLCDKIAKLIPLGFTLKETLEKVSEFREIYETDFKTRELIDFAKKLEGVARHASTHACGVVISAKPLQDLVPLQYSPKSEDIIITQYEMHAIEDLGLLKMDLLGLKNLTIIEDALARIYKVQGKSLKIEALPLNDKKTYRILQEGKTTGVFQMESEGFKRYLKQLKPTAFEDIVAMVALYRPGPMQFIPEYIERKHKRKIVKYLHPKLKPILQATQGICLFQEQLMQIARDLAGFTLSEADVLRKAVGKKIKKLLVSQKVKFIRGCIDNGIKKEIAQEIWQWILPFAHYGFNKAHSTAYGMIAYQTAYLKVHFPVEFMAALLTSEKADIERIAVLISESEKMGISVLEPDINESFRNFSVVPKKNKIRFGLLAIKNVGHNVVTAIISERKKGGPFKSFSDFVTRIESKDLNKRSLESLIKSGTFDKFEKERNKLLSNVEDILTFNRNIRKNKENHQKSLFDGNSNFNSDLKLKTAKPIDIQQKLLWEKELLGLYVSSHPLESFKKILEKKTIKISEATGQLKNSRIKVGGIISKIKRILTKNGKPMLFMNIEDLTGKIEVVVFPLMVERKPTLFQENKIILLSGKLDNRDGIPKLICEDIEEIINKEL